MTQPYPTDEAASLFEDETSPDSWVEVHGDRFVQIPEALLYDTAIDSTAVRVYGALRRHGEDPSNCFPSHERLGLLLGMATRSLQRPLVLLENEGWITRVYRSIGIHEISCGYDVYSAPIPEEDRGPRVLERAGRAQERVLARAQERGVARAVERGEGEQEERESINEPTAKSARRSKTRIPDEFPVTPEMLKWAKEHTPAILVEAETTKFLDYWKSRGDTRIDWLASWRNWMRNAVTYKENRERTNSGKPKSAIRLPIIEDRTPGAGPLTDEDLYGQ